MSFWAEVGVSDRRPESNFCGLSKANKQKREAFSRCGIWLQISVTCYLDVTFVKVSHQDSKPYPIVAPLLGFCSDRRRERLTPSQKLRLQNRARFFRSEWQAGCLFCYICSSRSTFAVVFFFICIPLLAFPTSFCAKPWYFRIFFEKTLYFFIILCYHMGWDRNYHLLFNTY